MRQTIVQAQKPRSEISIASDWLRVRYHDAAGSGTAAYEGKLSGAAVSGDLTLSGTTTNVFNDRGFVMPEAVNGNGIAIDADSNLPFENFFRPDTLGTGGILMFGVLKFQGTPVSGTGRLFAYGALNSTRGGYVLHMVAGANKNIQLQMYGIGGSLLNASKAITNTAGVETPFMGYLTTDTLYMSIDGNWAAVNTADVSAQVHRGLLSAEDGIGFLCNTDYAGTAAATELNAFTTTGNEFLHHGMTFVRASFTQAELTKLATEHAANPREIPPSLDGK